LTVSFFIVHPVAVALNYQTFGLPKAINNVFFKQNGNCGYILKPRSLINPLEALSKE
jgi:hypothetical protein